MTIADVALFYERRDAAQATGTEPLCTGCDVKLARGDSFSHYDLKSTAARQLPTNIVLCQKCTYLVIGFRP